MDADLARLCQCPACGGSLDATGRVIRCVACRAVFPALGGIPCLFRDPERQLADWRRQAARFQSLIERSTGLMEKQLQQFDLIPLTRGRLQGLRAATLENCERLLALLRGAGLAPDAAAAGRDGDGQGTPGFTLIEYYNHIVRDWAAWDETGGAENARAVDLVTAALDGRGSTPAPAAPELGRVLVLGAGACRLAYDLNVRYAPALTVALDVSPLLLLAAKRILFGTGLSLYEFPVIPRDLSTVFVERDLRLPGKEPARFHLLLADAFNAPLRPGSFDTVVTPWFIDIVPVDLRETLSVVHTLLAPGGRWVNHGPLNHPEDQEHVLRYTIEEVSELCGLAGFDLGPVRRDRVDLLNSPAGARARSEQVFTFAARKGAAAPTPAATGPTAADVPPWILFAHLPVPRFPGLDTEVPEHPILAYLARTIDGTLTLKDLAARMVRDHGARPEVALSGTRALLGVLYQACRGLG